MQYSNGKQKSFLQSLTWVSVMLLVMGLVFLSVAIILQLVPLQPEDITYSVNGVRRPSTQETVSTFRLIFLLVFGLIGLGLSTGGVISLVRSAGRRSRESQLKAEGAYLTAYVTDYAPSAVRVNNRSLARIRCAYNAPDGSTYIFKSGLLRMDPYPYLTEGQLRVYYDPNNMSRYFVDVDESAGLGGRVVEL